jgi:hypothetical protein
LPQIVGSFGTLLEKGRNGCGVASEQCSPRFDVVSVYRTVRSPRANLASSAFEQPWIQPDSRRDLPMKIEAALLGKQVRF